MKRQRHGEWKKIKTGNCCSSCGGEELECEVAEGVEAEEVAEAADAVEAAEAVEAGE